MRPTFALAVAVTAATSLGCQSDNQDIKKELAGIRQDLQGLRAQLGQLGRGGAAARAQPPGPDPAKVYAVGVAGSPTVGPAEAPVTVVMAYEYACPWCNRQRLVFPELQKAYGDNVRFVFRPFVVHPDHATDAALAACAADRQGRFSEVSDALWTGVFEKRAFDRPAVERVAGSVAGVDLARLRADMDGACKAYVEDERKALGELGVNATPQVWVNGRPIPGGYKAIEGLKPVIDEELARAKERIAAGTPRDAYYAEWVVKKGLRKLDGNGS
jgi:protein-disulfide isomerase